jgi:hypothetical protein
MADFDIFDPTEVVDKRRGRGTTGAQPMAEIANTLSISALKARLTALNATSYSAARLATMTRNDMLYALRIASADSAGI